MKHPSFSLVAAVVLASLAGARPGGAQTGAEPAAKDIMKLKLDCAHYILNGIATENFGIVASNAEKLSRLSQASAWRARQTAAYEVLSADFRRNADALAKAAKDRNADAAALAYVQMTLSCVNCHKYMREGKGTGAL